MVGKLLRNRRRLRAAPRPKPVTTTPPPPPTRINITTKNNGHFHRWVRIRPFTSFNKGHKHLISIKKRIALPTKKGGHTHKLK